MERIIEEMNTKINQGYSVWTDRGREYRQDKRWVGYCKQDAIEELIRLKDASLNMPYRIKIQKWIRQIKSELEGK